MQKVLIYDPDELFRRNLKSILESNGFKVRDASRPGEAVKYVLGERFDTFILCWESEETDSVQILSAIIRNFNYKLPVIIVTGSNVPLSSVSSFIHESFRLFQKPVDCNEIVKSVLEVVSINANVNRSL